MKFAAFILALLLPFTLAAPASESDDMVMTPAGPLPASNVHAVPTGGSVNVVGNEIHLLDASNNVVHVAQADYTPRPDWQAGWIAYAWWYNSVTSSPINWFNATWTVPPAPLTYRGQIVYLFNGMQPASGNAILQPVLQYGVSPAGGGAYWAVANWYLVSGHIYHTSLVNVSVGQALYGIMALTSSSGSLFNYVSWFSGVGDPLYVTNSAQLDWATEALEAYSINAATDYPAGATLFYNINLYRTTGIPSVSWTATYNTADGLTASVVANGAVNAQVRFSYPT